MNTIREETFLRNELGLKGIFIFILPFLVVIPIILQHLNLSIIGNSYGPRYVVFEMFGCCVALTVIAYASFRCASEKQNA